MNTLPKKFIFALALLLLPLNFASAASNITVIFERTPLFAESAIAPGDSVVRFVKVKNHSVTNKKVQFRVRVDEGNSSAELLKISKLTISSGDDELFSSTLKDSANKEFFLTNIIASTSQTFFASIFLPEEAGDELQGAGMTFDLDFGFAGEPTPSPSPCELEDECEEPTPSPTPTTTPPVSGGGGGGGSITFSNLVDQNQSTPNNTNGGGTTTTPSPSPASDNPSSSNSDSQSNADFNGAIKKAISDIGNFINGTASLSIGNGGSLSQEIEPTELQASLLQSLLGTIGLDNSYLAFIGALILFILFIIFWKRRKKEDKK